MAESNSLHDETYLDLMHDIIIMGTPKSDRTGTGTISLPFQQMRFDISDGSIPLLTTKRVFTKGIIHELLWFLAGDTNIKYLVDNGVNIWNEWPHAHYIKTTGDNITLSEFVEKIKTNVAFADMWGSIGEGYGAQWRRWPSSDETTIDQISIVVDQLRNNPTDRRIIVNAWNVGMLDKMLLPPCHMMFQFWSDGVHLSCQLYQRSADFFLGVPFNIAQYSMLTHAVAHVTGLKAKEFVWVGGDVHIYNNHLDQCHEQKARRPYKSPTLAKFSTNVRELSDLKFDDFVIEGYQYHPAIKAPVSV